MPEPQIPQKPVISLDEPKIAPINDALIRTMPERYIGAPAGKPPVVREIVETKTVVAAPPLRQGSAGPAAPPKPPAKKSNKRLVIISGAIFVLLAGLGSAAFILLSPAPEPPPPPSVCGNSVVETGEACDLGQQNGVTDSGCSATCRKVSITPPPPPPPVCGNSVVETGEACDLGQQNGVTDSGCSSTCQLSSKTPPPPPNTGIDSDSDGLTDVEETTVYSTDPLKLDTDGDSFNDGNEVSHLYDPMIKAPAMLKDSEAVVRAINSPENYSVLLPAKWARSGQETPQFLAAAPTGEFFGVLVTTKPTDQSLVEWYLALSPGTSASDVERFKTIQGYDALRSPDRLTTYIDPGDGSVYTLTYSFDDQTKLEFRTTYEAFVGSFTLVKQ